MTAVLQLSTMVPPARFGGAELVVAAFADQLQRSGFQVHNRGLKPRGDNGAAVPIPNVYWPFNGRRRSALQRMAWHAVDALTLSGRRPVERVIDQIAPDVIITHNLRGWGLAPWVAAEQRGIPLVHVVHDYGLLCNTSTLWHDGDTCEKSCVPCRLRLAMAVKRWPGGLLVGVSESVLAEHRRRGFNTSGPTAVLHPVMAAQSTVPGARQRTQAAPSTFGYLGRLSTEKGLDLLLDAITDSGKQLVVAGDGPESGAFENRLPGQVQWRGWMDPGEFFDEIDVLVVPSRWREPFGLVVVEAARAGVPVLLADQPGLIEAATVSGACYRQFAANDAAALRAALDVPISGYRAGPGQPAHPDIVDLISSLLPASSR